MGDGTDGNEIDASFRNFPQGLQRNATAGFKMWFAAGSTQDHGLAEMLVAHVIKQDMIYSFQLEKIPNLFQAVGFQFHIHPRPVRLQLLDRCLNRFHPTFRDEVVVLHHRAIIEAEAMIAAASIQHGFFF